MRRSLHSTLQCLLTTCSGHLPRLPIPLCALSLATLAILRPPPLQRESIVNWRQSQGLMNTWRASTTDNILGSNTERTAAESLRAQSLRLRNDSEKMRETRNRDVNDSLRRKMRETNDCMNRLTIGISDNAKEISDLTDGKRRLEKAIADKSVPLAIAERCLERRGQRPNREMIRDPVEENLETEYADLLDAVASLKAELDQTNMELERLEYAKSVMEDDLADKKSAQDLDNECLTIRLQKSNK